jgi:hypothetical protein
VRHACSISQWPFGLAIDPTPVTGYGLFASRSSISRWLGEIHFVSISFAADVQIYVHTLARDSRSPDDVPRFRKYAEYPTIVVASFGPQYSWVIQQGKVDERAIF